MTQTFDEARRDAMEALRMLNIDENTLVGMRRTYDETTAELVAAGFPRSAAGAMTALAIMRALNSIPAFTPIRLTALMESLKAGEPLLVPIEATTAVMIVLSTAAPDPEWDRGEG